MIIECKELSFTSEDIEKEDNKEQLKYYKRNLDLITGNIKAEIEDYKSAYSVRGVNGDYEWLRRANTKRRYYSFLSKKLQDRMGYISDKQKEIHMIKNLEERKMFESSFRGRAKELLSKEMYNLILNQSIDRF
jgi:hypothetical protein